MFRLDKKVLAILVEAQRHGVIGKAPLEGHVEQARAFFRIVEDRVPPTARVLDLGTGGGLPGLVIAATWPLLSMALLDGRSNRTQQLLRAVDELAWTDRVRVIGRRAEEAGRENTLRESFDLVVARGFGPPAVTAECAAPFLTQGGLLVVSDPPGGGGVERWPADGCGQLGLSVLERCFEPWAFTVLIQTERCSDNFPRRTGIPLKRPLFS